MLGATLPSLLALLGGCRGLAKLLQGPDALAVERRLGAQAPLDQPANPAGALTRIHLDGEARVANLHASQHRVVHRRVQPMPPPQPGELDRPDLAAVVELGLGQQVALAGAGREVPQGVEGGARRARERVAQLDLLVGLSVAVGQHGRRRVEERVDEVEVGHAELCLEVGQVLGRDRARLGRELVAQIEQRGRPIRRDHVEPGSADDGGLVERHHAREDDRPARDRAGHRLLLDAPLLPGEEIAQEEAPPGLDAQDLVEAGRARTGRLEEAALERVEPLSVLGDVGPAERLARPVVGVVLGVGDPGVDRPGDELLHELGVLLGRAVVRLTLLGLGRDEVPPDDAQDVVPVALPRPVPDLGNQARLGSAHAVPGAAPRPARRRVLPAAALVLPPAPAGAGGVARDVTSLGHGRPPGSVGTTRLARSARRPAQGSRQALQQGGEHVSRLGRRLDAQPARGGTLDGELAEERRHVRGRGGRSRRGVR